MINNDIKLILMVAVALLFGIGIFASIHSVPAGHKGVVVVFGNVKNEILTEGLHVLNPFAQVVDIDTREKREEINLSTYTRDIQLAQLTVVITYTINGDNVNKLYQTVGVNYTDRLITPILETAIKDVVGKWEADKLVENRNKAVDEMRVILSKSLNKEFLKFSTFSLTNIDYSDAFEKSIEEKQIATQNAIKAKNNTVKIMEEAKQQVISAEAEAEAMRIKSNALKTNKSLIEYEAVQKWDGKLPQYTGGGAMPFINLNPQK